MQSQNGRNGADEEFEEEVLQTELTQEAFEELAALEGAVVIGVSFWESSLADDLEEPPDEESRMLVDLDLYLEDNTLLELYGCLLYSSLEGLPLAGAQTQEDALIKLVDSESELAEVAESEEGELVLIFASGAQPSLILVVGAWMVSEWEELPEE